jgi:hypothetical protein
MNGTTKVLVPAIALTLVVGSLALAIIDEDTRPAFAKLAEAGLVGLFALSTPGSRKGS